MNFAFYKYLLKFYLLSMVVMLLLRVSFLLTYSADAFHSPAKDLLLSFGIGWLIDSSVVSVCIVLSLILVAFISIFKMNFQRLFFLLSIFFLSLVFLVNIIDIFYFGQFGMRLQLFGLMEKQLLSTVIPMLYNEYPVIRILILFSVLIFVFVFISKRIFKKHFSPENKITLKWSAISLVSFFALSFLYYDGPFWMLTSFSSSSLLNQMSSNGAYTLVKSIAQKNIYKNSFTIFPEIPDSTAIRFVKNISLHNDEVSLSDKFPTLRKLLSPTITQKKNIVIIICESFSASHIGVLGGKKLSPRFDEWSKRGVLFTHCYSNGPRTHFGLTSTVAGFPSIIGSSLIRRKGLNEFHTLGNILLDAGYDTKFFYSGDANFDDMKFFMKQGGFTTILDVNDFQKPRWKNAMGVCDEDLYDNAYKEIFTGETQPQLSVILNVSNHAPHRVPDYFQQSNPEVKTMEEKESTFYYEDYALGKFLDKCSTAKIFDNTIFLILADHGEVYELKDQDYKVYHIPALLLNTSLVAGKFDSVCSQMDFASTLINECGYNGAYHFIGQNLFNADFHPFAISRNTQAALAYHYENKVYFTDLQYGMSSYYMLDSLSYPSKKFEPSEEERTRTKNFLKNYLEGLSVIYRDGLYQSKNISVK